MNYSISGYNLYEENEFCIENVIMNEEKMNNLKKLDQIAVLEDGWNGNKAKAFEKQFILTVRKFNQKYSQQHVIQYNLSMKKKMVHI